MNKIIKGLECCKSVIGGNCDACPYVCCNMYEDSDAIKDAIVLIKDQKEEIERLQKLLDEKCDIIKDREDEIEKLNEKNKAYPCRVNVGNNCLVYARSLDDYDKFIGDVSNEGIKEFAERLKEKQEYYENGEGYEGFMVDVEEIDNLVKELTEAKK